MELSKNGKELSYEIENPDEETFETDMNISDGKEDYQVKICFIKNVGSVFIDTKLRWGMDYLKGSKLNLTTGTIQVVDENGNHMGRPEAERKTAMKPDWFYRCYFYAFAVFKISMMTASPMLSSVPVS